jgi:hypothetical protein
MRALRKKRGVRKSTFSINVFSRSSTAILSLILFLAGIASARLALGRPGPPQESTRPKIAEGEYVIRERENGGAFETGMAKLRS